METSKMETSKDISEKDRKNAIKSLSQHLDKKYCKKIENGVYDFTQQYCISNCDKPIMASAIYCDTVKNLLFNFEQKHSTIEKIKKEIIRGKYNAYNLAFLGPEELDKDNWNKIILRKTTTEEKMNNLPTIEWKACRVCKNTEYFYYQLQTRRADEAMTTFYICKECEKTYKVNN